MSPGCDDFGTLFDPEAVANLKRILDFVPDERIVVESSWKVNGLGELGKMWAEHKLPGTLYDVIPTFFCEELLIIDHSGPANIRKVEGISKGKEIRTWLRRHAGPDCRYVILDDVTELDSDLRSRAVQTDSRVGLTESDVMAVVKCLKS